MGSVNLVGKTISNYKYAWPVRNSLSSVVWMLNNEGRVRDGSALFVIVFQMEKSTRMFGEKTMPLTIPVKWFSYDAGFQFKSYTNFNFCYPSLNRNILNDYGYLIHITFPREVQLAISLMLVVYFNRGVGYRVRLRLKAVLGISSPLG